jgi:DNA-directed RNA polymerase specialized sigma subunit
MRNQTADQNAVSKFFDSLFLSIEEISENNNQVFDIPDKQPEYNEEMFSIYLKSLLQRYLNRKEYEVLRLSYGLDCPKHSAKEIAYKLQIKGQSAYVRVSQLKKQAVERLKQNVKHSEILDYIP